MVEYESTIFEDETPQSKRDLFEFRSKSMLRSQ